MTTINEPQPSASTPAVPILVLPGRRVAAGRGVAWIGEGWRLFVKAPLMWIVAVMLLFLCSVILSIVPFLGWAALQVLNPVYTAGFSVACRSLETGGDFEIDQLLAGFRTRFGPLAIVGLLFLAGMAVILLVFALAAGLSAIASFMSGAVNLEDWPTVVAQSALLFSLGTLVALALWIPLLAAYWFAPTLVVLHDVPPVKAMTASFAACFRNFIPYLVYGVIIGAIALVALIPAIALPLVGWLVTAAVYMVIYIVNATAAYAAYRDIFIRRDRGGAR
jgi:uncharacterized membrane protein